MSELSTVHTPSFLKASVKENNMIISKENRELVSLSGRSGYGTNNPDFEVDIRSADMMDGSTLQLRGLLKLVNAADEDAECHLQGLGAYSLIPQIYFEYNGQTVLNITSRGAEIANLNSVLHDDATVRAIKEAKCLYDTQLVAGTSYSFVLDLSQYGSVLNNYLASGSLATMRVKIRFETQLQRVFYEKAGDTVTGAFTAYELNDLRLTADFMKFQVDAQRAILQQLQSPAGVKMATHSFIPNVETLQESTTHKLQGSFQYRNLVSVFFLPVPLSVAADGTSGISATDALGVVQYEGANFPTNVRVRLAGMNYINENASSGTSNKYELFDGTYKASQMTPTNTSIGYKLIDGYANDNYQVFGCSFVRGNDNLVEIQNSGVNAFVARGILDTEFNTTEGQAQKVMLTVGVVTTVLEVNNGQARVIQ